MTGFPRGTFIESAVALGICGPRIVLAHPVERFLADGQSVILEADSGDDIWPHDNLAWIRMDI